MKKRTFLKTSGIVIAGSTFRSMIPRFQSDVGKNWAGNLTYSARKLHQPNSVEEIQEIVSKATNIRTLGTRHSFSAIADCPSEMISSRGLDHIYEIDRQRRRVTIGAGIRYGELSQYLQRYDFALHNLASLPHISVAGAVATATHGSGDQNGNLASIVKGLEFVKADGSIAKLYPGNDDFPGAVVGLGALGVVTRMVLEIQPTYEVRQDILMDLPIESAKENFHEIFASGYSVSFFTDWSGPSINQVWIKRRSEGASDLKELFGAKPATRKMHPIASVSAENCTEQMGQDGPWHERLPHFKLDFTPSNGDELQSEFFVPRENAPEALMALQAMGNKLTPLLYISEVRSIAGDDFWMSTAYGGDRIAFHFTWKPNLEGVLAILPELEDTLSEYGVRPHWGKIFNMKADRIASVYPRIDDFKSLVQKYDPEGKFQNDFLKQKVFGG